MQFSIVDLPSDQKGRNIVIVEAGEGKLGMFCNMGAFLHYAIRHKKGVGSQEWQMENAIQFPVNYDCHIFAAAEGYIFLQGVSKIQYKVPAVIFSLEMKTLKIETVGKMSCLGPSHVRPWFGFPPSIAARRI
ncbi:hypothetical protein ACP4OV_007282 [Aristida adscensionis]